MNNLNGEQKLKLSIWWENQISSNGLVVHPLGGVEIEMIIIGWKIKSVNRVDLIGLIEKQLIGFTNLMIYSSSWLTFQKV